MLALKIRKHIHKPKSKVKREVKLSARDIEEIELYFALTAYCGR